MVTNRHHGNRHHGNRHHGNRHHGRRHHGRHYGGYGGGDYGGGDLYVAPGIVGAEYGVLLTDVSQGPAANAGLQPDDIILSYNGQPTPSYEDLAAAVQSSGSQAEVSYISGDNGDQETVTLSGVNGRIGVTGYGVPVPTD
jgi:S1-C subfamily serine protease